MLALLCVDPHPVVAAGLAAIAASDPDLEVVGAARDAESAIAALAERPADLVLMDPPLLGPDGFALCRRVKETAPHARVVVYTDTAWSTGITLQARVACADGLIDKGTEGPELLEALRAIDAGALALPPLRPGELEAAAQRVEPGDLALLAMLADRTPPSDVADTLRIDSRGVLRRIDRLLPRLSGLSGRKPHPA